MVLLLTLDSLAPKQLNSVYIWTLAQENVYDTAVQVTSLVYVLYTCRVHFAISVHVSVVLTWQIHNPQPGRLRSHSL